MNLADPEWRNQVGSKSTRLSFHSVLVSAAVAGSRAFTAGVAALAVGLFGTLLLGADNLLTRLRAAIRALKDGLTPRRLLLIDRHHNEIQRLVLLRFVLQNTATESPSMPPENRRARKGAQLLSRIDKGEKEELKAIRRANQRG